MQSTEISLCTIIVCFSLATISQSRLTFTLPPLVNHGWLLPCHHQSSIICFSLATTSQSRLTNGGKVKVNRDWLYLQVATINQSWLTFTLPPSPISALGFQLILQVKVSGVEELPQEWPRFGLKLSRKLSISSSLLCWGERHVSSLVHAPRQRSHEPWLACVFPSVRGIMHTFPWLACVFPSVRGIMHTSPWLACVFPSVRGIMHTSACPFFELILRVRDMSSGTFLVVPGIVTMPFVLAFLGIRVLACSFKILCQCLQYHGLKHGPEI